MKKIYWIDDNINYINYYIQGIIKELWGDENEEGISSHRRELKQLTQAKYWHENPDSDWFCAVLKVINNDAFSRF